MNEQELQQLLQDPQFWSWLSLKTGQPEEECQQMVSQMLLSGDLLAQLQFILIVLQYMQETLVQAARFGMKVNYLKQLYGNCPAGTELQYYKVGGRICKKCVKKHQRGGIQPDDPINRFRSEHKDKLKEAIQPNKPSTQPNDKPITPLNNQSSNSMVKTKAVGGTVDQPAKYNKRFCKKHAEGGTIAKGQYGLMSRSIMDFLGKLKSPVAERLLKYAEKLPDKYKTRFYKLLEEEQNSIKDMNNANDIIKKFLKTNHENVDDLNRYQDWIYNLYLSGKMSEGKYHDLFQASEDRAFDAGYDREGGVIEGQEGFTSLDLINALKKALPTHPLGTIKDIVSKLGILGDTNEIKKMFGDDVDNVVRGILRKIGKPNTGPNKIPVESPPYTGGMPNKMPNAESQLKPEYGPKYKLYRKGGQISTIERIRMALNYHKRR